MRKKDKEGKIKRHHSLKRRQVTSKTLLCGARGEDAEERERMIERWENVTDAQIVKEEEDKVRSGRGKGMRERG